MFGGAELILRYTLLLLGKMPCVYGKDPCLCSKCVHCGYCTSGSQYHRSCFCEEHIELMAEDAEVSELMAGAEESLPTEEQEVAAIAVQRNTPFSAQDEEMETFENNLLFEKTYQFELCKPMLILFCQLLLKIILTKLLMVLILRD